MMAQTLFKAIKAQDSAATIDVLAQDWSRPLLQRMPEVRQAHPMPIGHGRLALRERYQIAKRLSTFNFTKAIVLPHSWKSALIPWWANIPKRVGYLGECRFGLLNDFRLLDKTRYPRLIDRYVALAYEKNSTLPHSIEFPSFDIDPASVAKTSEKFLNNQTLNRPILALCPGAEFGPSKRWPERYYAEVALAKQKEGWLVFIFGSKNDEKVAASIQEKVNGSFNFTGKTSLDEAINLLSLASLVVSNDSGLMHIAAAMQKPLVAVYGSTDPGYTPPLGKTSKIVKLSISCSPCFKRECPLQHHQCMNNLLPNAVLTAMQEVVS